MHFTPKNVAEGFAKAIAEQKLLIQHPDKLSAGMGCANIYRKEDFPNLPHDCHCIIGSILPPQLMSAFGFIDSGFARLRVTAESRELEETLTLLQHEHDNLIAEADMLIGNGHNPSQEMGWLQSRDRFLAKTAEMFPVPVSN